MDTFVILWCPPCVPCEEGKTCCKYMMGNVNRVRNRVRMSA